MDRAHEQFRWFAGGWAVNADLPTTGAYWEAGFTDIAVVQIGGEHQERFLAEAAEPLLAKLRDASPGSGR